MNELDIEVVKEKYIQYKNDHYDDEREMRKLLKLKKLVPSLAEDSNWKKDFKNLNDNLSDGLYYYSELKKILPEDELKNFMDKVKFDILKNRYIKYKLDKFDDNFYSELSDNENLFEEALNIDEKVIPKVDKFDKKLFAKSLLDEKELIKKIEIVLRYQKSTIDVFFDTTAVLKAELARLLIEKMNIDGVDKNRVITTCLVYAFKRTNSPMEIERIKKEKENDKKFLLSLGFDEKFCKICGEYNRYNEPIDYEREKEGDILEIMDKFVGLIMHREDRLAFPVDEAIELLDRKVLDGIDNRYENKLIQFIGWLEGIEVSRGIGIMTYFANSINSSQRHDFASIIETIIKIREIIGGPINEMKVMKIEKMEKVQDKYSLIQYLQKIVKKLRDKIASLSKILRGYKKLSSGNMDKDYLNR